MNRFWRVVIFLISMGVFACSSTLSISEEEVLPVKIFEKPESFPEPVYDFSKNQLSKEGVLLGKKIFFDGRLSRDGTISCAECHNQAYNFTHHGHALSHGIEDRVGTRNSMPLVNLAWQNVFFWDGGVFDLDLFSIAPIHNPVEMDEEIGNVLDKLKKDKEYPILFKNAFGTDEINTQSFLKSLSQFMLTLVSADSKYDKYLKGQANFTDEEKEGLRLFNEKACTNCHKPPLFTDNSFKSNGLSTDFFRNFVDKGRFNITELEQDKYKFKVPTLRNIEYSFPYMHDGRYLTLEQVLDHYTSKVTNIENLDPIFIKANKMGLDISREEKVKIIAFLKTLTDESFLRDKRFAP